MSERRFKRGDLVRFKAGTRIVQGTVKEDRGPIGLKGRRLYLIDFGPPQYAEEPHLIELPAVELELVPDKVAAKKDSVPNEAS